MHSFLEIGLHYYFCNGAQIPGEAGKIINIIPLSARAASKWQIGTWRVIHNCMCLDIRVLTAMERHWLATQWVLLWMGSRSRNVEALKESHISIFHLWSRRNSKVCMVEWGSNSNSHMKQPIDIWNLKVWYKRCNWKRARNKQLMWFKFIRRVHKIFLLLNILENTDGKRRSCTPPLMQGQCTKILICIELSNSAEVNRFNSAIFKSKSKIEIQS